MKLKTPCTANHRFIQLIPSALHDGTKKFTFVAMESIGSIEYFINKRNECFIHDFTIKEPYRRQGRGECLYRYLEQNLFQPKCAAIEILSVPESVHFWKKQEFEYTDSDEVMREEKMIKVLKNNLPPLKTPSLCDDVQLVHDEFQKEITQHKIRENYNVLNRQKSECDGKNTLECIQFRQKLFIYEQGSKNMDAADAMLADICEAKKETSNACKTYASICSSWREEIARFTPYIKIAQMRKRYENIMRACNRVLIDACELPII